MEISQVVTNMLHKTNVFRCVFQINHIYYFFIAFHKALSVFHTSCCFLFKTFPTSFPPPSSSRAEISPCIRPLIKALRPEGILLNDPNRAGRLIANHLFLCYSFVISCLCEFRLFSQAVDVKPGLFRTNQTWFDVNGGTISKN